MDIVHLNYFQSPPSILGILTKTRAVQLPFTSLVPVRFMASLHVCIYYFQASLIYTI